MSTKVVGIQNHALSYFGSHYPSAGRSGYAIFGLKVMTCRKAHGRPRSRCVLRSDASRTRSSLGC